MPAAVFERALAPLAAEHEFSFLQIDGDSGFQPQTPSERAIREYAGTPASVAGRLIDEEALVVHGAPVTDAVLGASPKLKLVCCARGGPVNVDLAAASRLGIPVVTTPGKNAEAVADLTLALLLMLARDIPGALRFVATSGDLGGSAFEGSGFFGVERARIDGPGVSASSLTDLLAWSDFVSLHARATVENKNLFSRGQFEAMRQGAYFVNTARETLVDEDALHEALISGRLAGAALDVIRPRPDGGAHPLTALKNVIRTPHIGGATRETLARGAQMIAKEIRRFTAGQPLVHVVNREALR
jgi:D-3-phosphoglycerate dehydrogenase